VLRFNAKSTPISSALEETMAPRLVSGSTDAHRAFFPRRVIATDEFNSAPPMDRMTVLISL
jgi:hypothetical protein